MERNHKSHIRSLILPHLHIYEYRCFVHRYIVLGLDCCCCGCFPDNQQSTFSVAPMAHPRLFCARYIADYRDRRLLRGRANAHVLPILEETLKKIGAPQPVMNNLLSQAPVPAYKDSTCLPAISQIFATFMIGVVGLKCHYKIILVCAYIPAQEHGMHRQVTRPTLLFFYKGVWDRD